jgi:hypothetical protein
LAGTDKNIELENQLKNTGLPAPFAQKENQLTAENVMSAFSKVLSPTSTETTSVL